MYQEKFNYTIPFNKESVQFWNYMFRTSFLVWSIYSWIWLNDYFFFNILLEPDKNLLHFQNWVMSITSDNFKLPIPFSSFLLKCEVGILWKIQDFIFNKCLLTFLTTYCSNVLLTCRPAIQLIDLLMSQAYFNVLLLYTSNFTNNNSCF